MSEGTATTDTAREPLRCFADPCAVVWLGGEAPLDFLQRMSTNALVDLKVGEGRYTVLTSDSGRAIDLLACYQGRAGVALLTTSPAAAAEVARHLRSYVLFGDAVTVTDAGGQVGVLRLTGADALARARALTGVDAPLSEAGSWLEQGEGEGSLWLLRHLEPGLGGVDIVLPRGAPLEALRARLRKDGIPEGTPADLDHLRIRAGLPAHGAEIDGQSNPLELGLLDAIDFAKGCYVGQEVIARLANYEKVQRRLVRLGADRPLQANLSLTPIASEEGRRPRPGRVTTAAVEPDAEPNPGTEASRRARARVEAREGSVVEQAPTMRRTWSALALVPLSTREGDRFAFVVDGSEGEAVVNARIGRIPGA